MRLRFLAMRSQELTQIHVALIIFIARYLDQLRRDIPEGYLVWPHAYARTEAYAHRHQESKRHESLSSRMFFLLMSGYDRGVVVKDNTRCLVLHMQRFPCGSENFFTYKPMTYVPGVGKVTCQIQRFRNITKFRREKSPAIFSYLRSWLTPSNFNENLIIAFFLGISRSIRRENIRLKFRDTRCMKNVYDANECECEKINKRRYLSRAAEYLVRTRVNVITREDMKDISGWFENGNYSVRRLFVARKKKALDERTAF